MPAGAVGFASLNPPTSYELKVAQEAGSSRMRRLSWSTTMEFTALFLAVTVVMVVAWRGTRTLALALFAATLVASIATYLHHASDVLKLSF
jgi:hypothetical protein